MADCLQEQITIRLKRKKCEQKDCRNNNEDNIELIVFGKENTKRKGFMCSQCLMDSQFLAQIKPIEKHSISIKKFLKTLTAKYKQYADEKNSVNWGPNVLDQRRRQIKQSLSSYQETLLRGILQIVNSVKQLQEKTLKQISVLHKDLSFQKLSQLLSQDDEEQERINVSNELKKVTINIMQCQGQYKMTNEKELKQKHQAIMENYYLKLKKAKVCLNSLIDTQKSTLKQLSLIQMQEQELDIIN